MFLSILQFGPGVAGVPELEFMTEGSGHAEVLCVDRVSVPYRVPDRVGLLLSNSSPMAYPDDFQVK